MDLNDSGVFKGETTNNDSNLQVEDKPNLQSPEQEHKNNPVSNQELKYKNQENSSDVQNSPTELSGDSDNENQSDNVSPREQTSNRTLEIEHDQELSKHDDDNSRQNDSLKEENDTLTSNESKERIGNEPLYQNNIERKPRAKDSGFEKWMSSIKPLEEISITKQNLLPPIATEMYNKGERSKTEEQQPTVDENGKQIEHEEEKSVLDLIEPVFDENYVSVTHTNPWKRLALILMVCLLVAVIIIIVLLILVVYFAASDENCASNNMESTTTDSISSSVTGSSTFMSTSMSSSIAQTTTTTTQSCPNQDLQTYCSAQQYAFTSGCCCYNSPDVVLVVDTSSSMLPLENTVKQFLVDLTSNFTLSASSTSIKFAMINTKPAVEWHLNSLITQSNAVISAAIQAADFTTGDSTFTVAYQTVVDQMLTSANGDRANVPNVVITIGDGDMTTTGLAAKFQALQNVTKLQIGVYTGSRPLNMASVATSTNLFSINQVNMVIDILRKQ